MRVASFLSIAVLTGSLTSGGLVAKGTGVGIYGIIDRVEFDRNEIRISGVFVVPKPMTSGDYRKAQRGELYFRMPLKYPELVLKEWEQLGTFAGTGQVVGFAFYWVPNPNDPAGNPHHALEVRVRASGDRAPADVYPLPFPGQVVKAGDGGFDAAVADRLKAKTRD